MFEWIFEEFWWKELMRSRTYATTLICIATLFVFADQNLLAPNMSAIAKEFHFSDVEKDWKLGGELAVGFFILGQV